MSTSPKLTGLTPLAKAMWHMRLIRVYKDGSSHSFVWNTLNPLAYALAFVFIIVAIVYYVFFGGLVELTKKQNWADIGLCVTPYFADRPHLLEWVHH